MGKHQHYWLDTGEPHPLVFLNEKFKYICSVCDKEKYFKHQPVNPIVPSAWEVYRNEVTKGNTRFVIAPPMFYQDNQWIEGERYRKLVKGLL